LSRRERPEPGNTIPGTSGEPVTPGVSPSFTWAMDSFGPAPTGPLPEACDLTDDDVERMLNGSGGPPAWFEVTELLDRTRMEAAVEPDDLWVRTHVAVAAAAARKANLVPDPTAGRRGRPVRVGAVAAATTTLIATMGLAAADTLPVPLQSVASHVASLVGVDVPDGRARIVMPGFGPLPASDGAPVDADPGSAPPTTARPPGHGSPPDERGPSSLPAGPGADGGGPTALRPAAGGGPEGRFDRPVARSGPLQARMDEWRLMVAREREILLGLLPPPPAAPPSVPPPATAPVNGWAGVPWVEPVWPALPPATVPAVPDTVVQAAGEPEVVDRWGTGRLRPFVAPPPAAPAAVAPPAAASPGPVATPPPSAVLPPLPRRSTGAVLPPVLPPAGDAAGGSPAP
jgi:hypothetical protein